MQRGQLKTPCGCGFLLTYEVEGLGILVGKIVSSMHTVDPGLIVFLIFELSLWRNSWGFTFPLLVCKAKKGQRQIACSDWKWSLSRLFLWTVNFSIIPKSLYIVSVMQLSSRTWKLLSMFSLISFPNQETSELGRRILNISDPDLSVSTRIFEGRSGITGLNENEVMSLELPWILKFL